MERALAVLVGLALAIAVVQTLRLAWQGARGSRRTRARMRRAVRGEHDAEALLEANGYTIRGRQVRTELEYVVDGAPCRFEVRADFVAERDGRAWIAEVKTGTLAPRLTTPATRRQLLEYAHAFDGAGVLLVDAEGARIAEVAVPVRRRSARVVFVFAAGALLGASVGWAIASS
jgi:hypothetical protein